MRKPGTESAPVPRAPAKVAAKKPR
jgi:hypothetical protein